MTYEKIFSQIGLTEQEATIYEIMLELGEARAKEIYQKSPFKRGLVYKLLDNLIEKHLIVRVDKPGKVSIFRIEHPDKINDLVEAQERKVRHYKKSIHSLMPELISSYNLAFNKPGIKFFEGENGVIKALNDTLKSRTEIYTYSDIYHTNEIGKKINNDYVNKRIKAQINKKVLAPISNKDLFPLENQAFTEVRFLDDNINPFITAMQIYDNKISYQTFDHNNMIAVIIEDKNIYSLHKGFFEFVWNNLAKEK